MADPLFASARSSVLRVALPVPVDSLFDYLPPADASGDESWPGRRVLVPFSGRRLAGVVVEARAAAEHPGRLERVERIVDEVAKTGLTLEEIQARSFVKILANRRRL